jgi:hypothetical protein
VAPDDLRYMVALGITGAPVVDLDERPIGFASLRDLVDATGSVEAVMQVPCETVHATESLAAAALQMGEHDRHHLVCVGDGGRAIGFISALDVLRGLTGQPVPHPTSFPHWDPETGLSWSNVARLQLEKVRELAPDGPGLYVLIQPRRDAPNQVVWSEASPNVHDRLVDMLARPDTAPRGLASQVELGQLWFRAARAPSSHALED